MFKLPVFRYFCISARCRNSFKPELETDSTKTDRIFSHVYNKTYTKKQLIEYINDNVVFESDDYIITSLPQGVPLKKTSQWIDTVTQNVCDTDLNETIKELPAVFKTEFLFLAYYPRSNTSGLTIFSKNYKALNVFRSNLILSASKKEYNYNFLAVVLGCPDQSLSQTFGVQARKFGEKYGTEILQKWKESKNIRKVGYKHEVLASTKLASLVKVEVTQDVRDCVRHILGVRCLTPVLGDVWNCLKCQSLFSGSHLQIDPVFILHNSLTIDPELLAKLNLKPGDEKLIPIHVHFHRLKLKLKNRRELLFSVPPPESFVWTCNQLEFKEIKNYLKSD